MNFIDSLAEYLEDNGLGTVGTDLYIGEIPLDVEGVSIGLAPSPAPDKSVPYYLQSIDVWSRNANVNTGFDALSEIFLLLHRSANYEVGDYHVYISYALGAIDDMGRDSQRRKLNKLSLGFVYR